MNKNEQPAIQSQKPSRKAKTLTSNELKEFIDAVKESPKPYKRVIIGHVSDEAKKRIEIEAKGKINAQKLNNINIDSESVYYALKKLHHNLESSDLLLAVEVINTATDIELSNTQHQDNDVILFKKDIDGEITFLTEVRIGKGYLLIFDAYRQKKAHSRKRFNAT